MRILDIDLDFFLNNHKLNIAEDSNDNRLPENEAKPWKEIRVIDFMENQCKLNKNKKINGITLQSHNEVFYKLRELIKNKLLTPPFDLIHIDAHADLGAGDASWSYIMGDLIHKPVAQRPYPKKNSPPGLHFGNWISFTIACRWIKKLDFVLHNKWVYDIPKQFLYDMNHHPVYLSHDVIDYGFHQFFIQMMPLTNLQIEDFRYGNEPSCYNQANLKEPEIKFRLIPNESYMNFDLFDFIFLTKSPGYTPLSADVLIPVIEEYFNPI